MFSCRRRIGHWMRHVSQLQSGNKAGSYIYSCSCGPSDLRWEHDYQAAAGLSLHMMERHSIAM